MKLEDTFMSGGIEYKIVHINQKKNRINVVLHGESTELPPLKSCVMVGNEMYVVTYINEGKKRISLDRKENSDARKFI